MAGLDLKDPMDYKPRAPAGMSSDEDGVPQFDEEFEPPAEEKLKTASLSPEQVKKLENLVSRVWNGVADDAEAAGEMSPEDKWDLISSHLEDDSLLQTDRTLRRAVRFGSPEFEEVREIALKELMKFGSVESPCVVSFPNMERRAWSRRPYFTFNWWEDVKTLAKQASGQELGDRKLDYFELSFTNRGTAERFAHQLVNQFKVPSTMVKVTSQGFERDAMPRFNRPPRSEEELEGTGLSPYEEAKELGLPFVCAYCGDSPKYPDVKFYPEYDAALCKQCHAESKAKPPKQGVKMSLSPNVMKLAHLLRQSGVKTAGVNEDMKAAAKELEGGGFGKVDLGQADDFHGVGTITISLPEEEGMGVDEEEEKLWFSGKAGQVEQLVSSLPSFDHIEAEPVYPWTITVHFRAPLSNPDADPSKPN